MDSETAAAFSLTYYTLSLRTLNPLPRLPNSRLGRADDIVKAVMASLENKALGFPFMSYSLEGRSLPLPQP